MRPLADSSKCTSLCSEAASLPIVERSHASITAVVRVHMGIHRGVVIIVIIHVVDARAGIASGIGRKEERTTQRRWAHISIVKDVRRLLETSVKVLLRSSAE